MSRDAHVSMQGVEKVYGAKRLGVDEKSDRVARALAMMGLTQFVILLDEACGALDQQTRLRMGDEVLDLWRKTGATVFLITQALDEAAMLADRIGVMSARPGRLIDIVETGWPRDRDSRIAQEDGFGAVTARLWRSLREETMRSMRHNP